MNIYKAKRALFAVEVPTTTRTAAAASTTSSSESVGVYLFMLRVPRSTNKIWLNNFYANNFVLLEKEERKRKNQKFIIEFAAFKFLMLSSAFAFHLSLQQQPHQTKVLIQRIRTNLRSRIFSRQLESWRLLSCAITIRS